MPRSISTSRSTRAARLAPLMLAGIALVSQIYHLNDRPSNGVLIWWMGIASLPYLLRSFSIQMVSVIGATLSGANLSQANLTNADFDLATLAGANFTGAEVRGATFSTIAAAQLY